MAKKKRKVRSKAKLELRKLEQKKRHLHAMKEKLFHLEAGGTPDRPCSVPSVSVIEIRARSTPCPLCQGSLQLQEHRALTHKNIPLRSVTVHCRQCTSRRTLWFHITGEAIN